jgi:transcriptional regulator with XRE-family HTH domain
MASSATSASSASNQVKNTKHRKFPHPLALEVGSRIRRIRKASDYSFDAFVEETGLGRGYISELERGLVVPSIATLSTIARAFELTLADLVIGNSDRELLFSELRNAPPNFIKRMRAELQIVGEKKTAATPRQSEVVSKKPRAKAKA